MMKSNIEELAEKIDNFSILILGGTGLFAKELIPKLTYYIDKKNIKTKIYITTRNKKKAVDFIPETKKSYVKFISIDFLLENKIKDDINPKYVLHMATTSAKETYNNISQLSKFIVLKNSTEALSKIIKRNQVKRVLLVSSGVAYGDIEVFKETHKSNLDNLDPKNSLAFGKLYSEFYLNSVCKLHNTELKIARCFSFISQYLPLNIHYAVGNFVRDALCKEAIVIKSDGKDIRSYQDLSDCVEWLAFMLNKEFDYKMINVGSDEGISILNLAKKIKSLLNPKAEIILKNEFMPDDNTRRRNYVPNLERAYELGLSQKINLEESIIGLSEYIKKRGF